MCHVIVGLFVQWSFSVTYCSGTVCTMVVYCVMLYWDRLFSGRLVCHVIVGLFVQWSFSVSCCSGTVCSVVV